MTRSTTSTGKHTTHAPAKINLSLQVLGKRADGYHDLVSLVAFAATGDTLTLTPGDTLRLDVEGPFAQSVSNTDNLVITAANAALAADPSLQVGHFLLEKSLPVAAGIGGGSADAAAALRLIRNANPERAPAIDWIALAASLGADVPVCLAGRPAVMAGVGDRLTPLPTLPAVWLVLANPSLPLATRDVFSALAAPPVTEPGLAQVPPSFATLDDLLAYLQARPNDLTATAIRLCPAIGDMLAMLQACPEALISRMSGSGPTCFALFREQDAAANACSLLARSRPGWWLTSTRLLP